MAGSYKIGLKGSQECKAPKAPQCGKKPVARKGSDLRSGSGKQQAEHGK